MTESNLKQKLKEQKQKSIQKRKDNDLKLYLDFMNELLEYRISLIPNNTVKQINSLTRKHKVILERLAKRLAIPTILSINKKNTKNSRL